MVAMATNNMNELAHRAFDFNQFHLMLANQCLSSTFQYSPCLNKLYLTHAVLECRVAPYCLGGPGFLEGGIRDTKAGDISVLRLRP